MAAPSVGVYVHVPFCERICPYCDFAVVRARPLERGLETRYVDALLRELEVRRAAYAGRELASLYFGGGTPSLLHPESLARLVAAVGDAFPRAAGPVEITLEVNPSTVERARLPAFREAGVTRVSVGVQSFDDTVLRRLGRAHRAAEADETLAACRAAGFPAISLDLIFAAPGQSLASLEADLARVAAYAPDHVSAYELSIESGTPFAAAAARGRLALPDEDLALAMLRTLEARLEAAGLARYEISSYARPGAQAVHNRRYWEREPVLGLGMGAVSTEPPRPGAPFGARTASARDLGAWLRAAEAGRPAEAAASEVLAPATARGEAVFLALRQTRGLDAAGFRAEFGRPPRGFFSAAIDALVAGGLLSEAASGDLGLTPRGRLVADSVFERFV